VTTATKTKINLVAEYMTELARSSELAKRLKAAIAEAEANDGLAVMPADLVPLREEKLRVDAQLDKLEARKKEIQGIFQARLEEAELIGYTIDDKVRARRLATSRSDIDAKGLKEKHPLIYKRFLRVTPYISMRIS
jgi:predicted phage-related endonuclease